MDNSKWISQLATNVKELILGSIDSDDDNRAFEVTLPFPPTVNTYWRRVGNKTLLSAHARQYHKDCAYFLAGSVKPIDYPVMAHVEFVLPDRRKRDLDNYAKALFDTLVKNNTLLDDSLIKACFNYFTYPGKEIWMDCFGMKKSYVNIQLFKIPLN